MRLLHLAILSDDEHAVALSNWRGKSKHTGKTYHDRMVLTTHTADQGWIRGAWAGWNTTQLNEALGG